MPVNRITFTHWRESPASPHGMLPACRPRNAKPPCTNEYGVATTHHFTFASLRDFKQCSAGVQVLPFDTAMGRAHTDGMEICQFIAAALTAAPPAAPRFLRRIQVSTSPRPA